MARRATLIDTLRAETPNLLLYDAGGFANEKPHVGVPATQFIVRMHARLGYTAITLGPRELGLGLDTFPLDGELPILLTNLYVAGEGGLVPAGRRYTIDDVGGLRIGAFSLLTTFIPQRVASLLGEYEVRDPMIVAREMIDFFEAEGVDVIVLLSQIERALVDRLLPAFHEIDVAILGHVTTPLTGRTDECEAVTLYGTRRGQAVASALLTVAPDGTTLEAAGAMHDLGRMVNEKPEIAELVAEVDAQLLALKKETDRARMRETLAAKEPDPGFVGGAACAACHEAEHEAWRESAHANAYQRLVDLGVHESADCLGCHTVGYGQTTGFDRARLEPNLSGVQCESCHGIGSVHFDASLTRTPEAMCVRCHDRTNSPDFDLGEYMEKIRHW